MPPVFPATGNKSVSVERVRIQGSTRSPFNGARKVQDWAAPKWSLTVQTPFMKEGDADVDTWIQFFEDCNGMQNTFTMDISRYVPGQSGLTAVTFRQVGTNNGWQMDNKRMFAFTLEALSE
jgi:hypothetical protein